MLAQLTAADKQLTNQRKQNKILFFFNLFYKLHHLPTTYSVALHLRSWYNTIMIFWVSFGFLIFALGLQIVRWIFIFRGGSLGFFLKAKPALSGFLKNISYGSKFIAPGLFLGAIFFIIGWYGYLTYSQYLIWRLGPPGIFFLPPYREIGYLLEYHLTRFLLYYIISLIVGGGLIALSYYGNKRFGERFFDAEEPYLGALAIFLLGNRAWLSGFAWIFYFLGLAGLYLVFHIFFLAKNKFNKMRSEQAVRIPLYWLWLPGAIVAMIISAR